MIAMSVYRRESRAFFECQWKDPVTGRVRTKSTKCDNRREAERFAARLAMEIEKGEDGPATETTWKEFRDIYEREAFPGRAKKTQNKLRDTLRLIEKLINPARLSAIREKQVQQIASHLWSLGRSGYTVRSHLEIIRRILRWAVKRRLLASVPEIQLPPEPADPMKGRAITGEEFDRMLAAVVSVVGEDREPAWQHLLSGLWLSGLRLAEAHKLHWTDETQITLDHSHGRPLLRIQGGSEKAKTFRLLPITPDFARWLAQTPRHERHGFIFNPLGEKRGRASEEAFGKTISKIGEAAGVKVASDGKRTKYASAHDLRRAFGLRWAMKTRAPILMKLMRHASITTTLKFYAGVEALAASNEIWRDETDTSTDTSSVDPSDTFENHQKTS